MLYATNARRYTYSDYEIHPADCLPRLILGYEQWSFHQGNKTYIPSFPAFFIIEHIADFTFFDIVRRRTLLSDTVGFISDLPVQVSWMYVNIVLKTENLSTFVRL